MKKVYVLVAALFAAFAALSVGSASFAADDCPSYGNCDQPSDTVPATDDTVPSTDVTTTVAETTTTVQATTTSLVTTTLADPTTIASTTTTEAVAGVTVSTDEVGQAAPTTTVRRAGSDGLLPNTGTDVAIPLILAGLAAGTGAATLLVRRRSNVS